MSKGTAAKKVVDYTITQLKNLFGNDKSATAIDKKIDRLIKNPNVKNSNSQIIAAGNAARKKIRRASKTTIQKPVAEDRIIGANISEVAAGRIGRSGSSDKADFEVELGKSGTVSRGTKSEPSTIDQETGNKGRVKRNKKVAELETKEEKGIATKEEKAELKKLNKLSSDADIKRASAAASTRSANARKGRGVSLAGEKGTIKVGVKQKLKDSNMMVGNTTNGITKEGEIIGKPTDNQINIVVRNMDARQKLSADAKRNLAKLKRMSKSDRQDAALQKMERKMVNTGPDKSGRKYNKGGFIDMRKTGMFR